MMKVNLEFLTFPLVKHKQMQNVQHHISGHILMFSVIPKPKYAYCIWRILQYAASRFCFEELYLTYGGSVVTIL